MREKRYSGTERQYYRIRYPLSYRPKVKIQGEDYDNDVVELSERGVRFLYTGTAQLSTGSKMRVRIIFYDGESFELEGELLRVEKEDVILRFSGSLPLNRIMKEQRYLITHSIGHM